MADIEALRQANIDQKAKLLAGLNLGANSKATVATRVVKRESGSPPVKKRKVGLTQAPTRTSARLQNVPAPSYKDESKLFALVDRPSRRSTTTTNSSGGRRQIELPQQPVDDINPADDIEDIKRGWVEWEPTGAAPSRDTDGTIRFEDAEDFTPNRTPEEMLRQGAFGGSYFRPVKSARLGIVVRDDYRELPASWIEGLTIDKQVASPVYDAEVNKYRAACGQTIEEWEAAGWIAHRYDVRGWFQWYCRFYQGRRCRDDDRQISRWRKCCGPTGRWKRMLLKKYVAHGIKQVWTEGEEVAVSPVMHQTCHHWAYQVEQRDLDEIWRFG